MDKTEKIINAVKQGKKPVEIAASHGKDGFTAAEQEKLVGQVADLWDTPFSYPLLQTMFLIARDEWYRLKILSLSVQHPSQAGENRVETLNNLEKVLNNLKPISPEQNRIWTRCDAIYLGIQALTLSEAGNLSKALQLYKQALEKYTQLGLSAPKERVQANIVQLESRMRTRMISPADISAISSPSMDKGNAALNIIYQSNPPISTQNQLQLSPEPVKTGVKQTSEIHKQEEQAEATEKPVEPTSEITGETLLPHEPISFTEEPLKQASQPTNEISPELKQERPTEELAEGVRLQINEYLTRQDESPAVDEFIETAWQQSSEYPSREETPQPVGLAAEPAWWQTSENLTEQGQAQPVEEPAKPVSEQTPDHSFEDDRVQSFFAPAKPVMEQLVENPSEPAQKLPSREIQTDVDQLFEKHNQLKIEIETLQQEIAEQYRISAEKILELTNQQFKLEKQVQKLEQRVKELTAQKETLQQGIKDLQQGSNMET